MNDLWLVNDGCRDVTCPICLKKFGVEWSTEYGDPVQGYSEVYFPCCQKSIIVEVDITVTYSPRLNRPADL